MSSNTSDTPTERADQTPSSPSIHASNGTSATGGLSRLPATVPFHDLSGEKLIHTAPRMPFNGVNVPSLGGIPLIAKLGQGGMGAVYYGIHPRLNQEVAVKVLPFDMAEKNPDAIQRFFREAQLAARVKSPHLVGVLDVNQETGLFYLVMEYVSGTSAQGHLREVLKTGAVGVEEAIALDICIAACTGLAAAHAKGIIHRDVKPDNIMLPRGEQSQALEYQNAKLADLGLARSDSLEQSSMTLSGACMGTPGFMAPEQAADAKSCLKPADVFAMGATLYALLSGTAPFAGTQLFNVLKATIESPHKPILQLRRDISTPTAELLDRCLAKNPTQRYVDASALLAAMNVCRVALEQPGKAPAAVARVSELLRAKEVGQSVHDSLKTTPPPTPSIPIAKTKSWSWFWAALLLLVTGGGAFAVWPYFSNVKNRNVVNERSKESDAIERNNKVEAHEHSDESTDNKRLPALRTESKLAEAKQTLATNLPEAYKARDKGDWDEVILLLKGPREILGDTEFVNKAIVDNLLKKAPTEIIRRNDFETKLTVAQNYLLTQKYNEALKAFEEARAKWPNAPRIKEIDDGEKKSNDALQEIKRQQEAALAKVEAERISGERKMAENKCDLLMAESIKLINSLPPNFKEKGEDAINSAIQVLSTAEIKVSDASRLVSHDAERTAFCNWELNIIRATKSFVKDENTTTAEYYLTLAEGYIQKLPDNAKLDAKAAIDTIRKSMKE